MATHQEIAQVTDQELLQRMINSHDDRFNEGFWDYFAEQLDPHLPDDPAMVDVGCGPGLFLRDLSSRYPGARLTGIDITRAMLDYAETLEYAGRRPDYCLHDITKEPIPLGDAAVDLLAMVAVLHVLNDPLAMCREVRRVLSPNGIFMLQDWVRTPLPMYLERMSSGVAPENEEAARSRLFRLFATHNKYTVDDWLWLLAEGGLKVMDCRQISSPHFRTFTCKVG